MAGQKFKISGHWFEPKQDIFKRGGHWFTVSKKFYKNGGHWYECSVNSSGFLAKIITSSGEEIEIVSDKQDKFDEQVKKQLIMQTTPFSLEFSYKE